MEPYKLCVSMATLSSECSTVSEKHNCGVALVGAVTDVMPSTKISDAEGNGMLRT